MFNLKQLNMVNISNNPRAKELYAIRDNITAKYVNIINSKFIELGYDIYSCQCLTETCMRIGFADGTWNDGSVRYDTTEIYIGYERKYDFNTHHYTQEYFRYEYNVSARGSFNPLENNTCTKYYNLIALLISNAADLKEIAQAYCDEISPTINEINDIWVEVNKAEQLEKDRIEKERFNNERIEQHTIFNASDVNTYFVLNKNTSIAHSHFIYRKQPAMIAANIAFDTIHDASNWIRENIHWRSQSDYKIIEKRKLKLAA